ncbi:hypothetical protein PIB30_088794 [Stylosanthes scabra]|uniref:Uncharacterized protein n=1 Tax=Stylosanthes scabra TaxID=79078 RepID=A0ABU6QUG2_9FABA|nr:hypothetical protein [Stylosanthes scabra]
MVDYNSADNSNYDEESSCHSTEEDEDVPHTLFVGGPRLVLPASLPIPNLSEVQSFFQELDLDARHAEDSTMECVVAEYNLLQCFFRAKQPAANHQHDVASDILPKFLRRCSCRSMPHTISEPRRLDGNILVLPPLSMEVSHLTTPRPCPTSIYRISVENLSRSRLQDRHRCGDQGDRRHPVT